jgi:hypothetical protein
VKNNGVYALLSDKGGICNETVLCPTCYELEENRNYAREMGAQSGDVQLRTFHFIEGRGELRCCICEEVDT